ncbi:hypothetical protein IE077_001837 [Cardiosporidium cionae]|uniref:Uncharacterized protein n=1 Tax=Cardiosporidium cionae TaxID=476202 RepID=A0ABQ7JCH8_9APIC|nr:hypothetical protein IE077_001837 [Cardiosporidium cionae]|eukprot:KAF8821594.1 hypothetical protein IE077_001837 [Cardiosporidium cionae]
MMPRDVKYNLLDKLRWFLFYFLRNSFAELLLYSLLLNCLWTYQLSFVEPFSSKQDGIKFYTFNAKSIRTLPHLHEPSPFVVKVAGDPVLLSLYGKSGDSSESKSEESKYFSESSFPQKYQQWMLVLGDGVEVDAGSSSFQYFSNSYNQDINYVPFTQGFLFSDSTKIIESAGLYYGSLLREVDASTGKTLRYVRLPDKLFAEGCSLMQLTGDERDQKCTYDARKNVADFVKDELASYQELPIIPKKHSLILQLTWRERKLIVYDYESFLPIFSFDIDFNGWGLASNTYSSYVSTHRIQEKSSAKQCSFQKFRLWATCGDSYLLELDASLIESTLRLYFEQSVDESKGKVTSPIPLAKRHVKIVKKVKIHCLGSSISMVNELEYDHSRNSIFGNIFGTFLVVEIDPDTGKCRSLTSMAGLHDPKHHSIDLSNDVMNGIAIRPDTEVHNVKEPPVFYFTGKRWPTVYSLTLKDITSSTSNIITWRDLQKHFPEFRIN